MPTLQGSCLCGKIKYEITGILETFKYCFCLRCQKVSGNAHVANLFVDKNGQLKWISGESNVTRFDLPEAKRFSHGFCTTCGSPVPYELRDKTAIVIPAGSLDGDPGIRPESIIYWDNRPCWYVEPDVVEKIGK